MLAPYVLDVLATDTQADQRRWPHVSKVTSPEGIPFRVVADVA